MELPPSASGLGTGGSAQHDKPEESQPLDSNLGEGEGEGEGSVAHAIISPCKSSFISMNALLAVQQVQILKF